MQGIVKNFIQSHYGSKRGMLNYYKHKAHFLLGKYRSYQNINFSNVERLIFICSGNICRSPLGEFAAKSFGIKSESFGLHCRGGDAADSRAVAFGKKHGIDMSSHQSRNIGQYKCEKADLIIGMEPVHAQELETVGIPPSQITTLPVWYSRNAYLHDPYNTIDEFFERCETNVLAGVRGLNSHLQLSRIPKD